MLEIRPFREPDWSTLWPLLRATFAAGESYAFATDISEAEARRVWLDVPAATFVATQAGRVVGTYFIKPNQAGPGDHVCNCGYIVDADAQGKGVAARMCEHSQEWAVSHGYRAMQFNFVVSTNERAVRLWQRLGYEIVGRLPGAFRHRERGFVDALVMFKTLVPYHPPP
jgi:GNAT superfamily N-acetyltransferase